MLIMTGERCPMCNQQVYMMLFPKSGNLFGVRQLQIAANVYIDTDGIMNVHDHHDAPQPEYCCIYCEWTSQ